MTSRGHSDRSLAPGIWWAAALYTVLTIAFTYPLSFHPGTHVFGDNPDTHFYVWTLSWDVHAFLHQPLAIFDANIYYPNRLTLAYSENQIGSALFAAPILWVSGNPVLAVNLVALIGCALCGIGAYVLGRRLGLEHGPAFICGLAYAFAPARFVRTGQAYLGTLQWIPFTLAALHAYFDRGTPRSLKWAAACFTLQALTSGHGAVLLAIAAAGFVVHRLIAGDPLAPMRRLRDLGISGALLLVPSILIYVPYRRVQLEMGLRRSLQDWAPSWQSFLAAQTHLQQWVLAWLPGLRVNETASANLFPGYLPIVLALVAVMGAIRVRRHRDPADRRIDPTPLYLAFALLGIWISMGPPLGVWPLIYWLPGFSFIRLSSRFMLLAMVGFAALSGLGIQHLASRAAGTTRRWLIVGVAGAMIGEFADMPLPMTPYVVTIPAVDRWLATRPGTFAIAEFPASSVVRYQTTYMLHSMGHWQRTIHGYSGFEAPLHTRLYQELRGFPDEASLHRLNELEIAYLVVHEEMYRPGEWAQVQERLQRFSDRLTLEYSEGTGRVYALRPLR
jgi:hypothetical protein